MATTTKKVYLAGPMSGYKDFNFPAFLSAAKALRAKGHTVFCPAEADLEEYGSLKEVEDEFKKDPMGNYKARLKIDIDWIMNQATAIALLPGWTASKGANAEFAVANAIGLEVIHLE